jgi:excisionase family DNA binding protein
LPLFLVADIRRRPVVGKSSSTSGTQLARDPRALRRAHATVHRFVEQFEAEVEDAVHAARSRQLAPIRHVEQVVRYLHSRYLVADQAAGPCPRKPRGLAVEPDFILAINALDAAPLASCLNAIHDAIAALEPYDGVPFNRKPIGFRKAGSAAAGPEETALAALELTGQSLIGLFRSVAEGLAASCMSKPARRKTPKGKPSGMLTPPQVAKQLGVSPDKILAWIRKGELDATNVATVGSARPRYRISEEDLAKFQGTRQNVKPPPKPPRRRKTDPNVIEFFK